MPSCVLPQMTAIKRYESKICLLSQMSWVFNQILSNLMQIKINKRWLCFLFLKKETTTYLFTISESFTFVYDTLHFSWLVFYHSLRNILIEWRYCKCMNSCVSFFWYYFNAFTFKGSIISFKRQIARFYSYSYASYHIGFKQRNGTKLYWF